ILVSQLHTYFRRDIRQLVKILDGEYAAPGHFRHFIQKRRTVEFLRRPVAKTKRIKDTDGVELRIGFLHQALDIALIVSTMIIAPVGQDEQGAFAVACTPHLAEAEIDGIEQRGAALWSSKHHAAL